MSPRNWRECPACVQKEKDRTKAAETALEAAYGKVTREKYEEMKKECEYQDVEESLREYYEIKPTNDGVFYVSYSCSCDNCGIEHSFKHTEDIKSKIKKALKE